MGETKKERKMTPKGFLAKATSTSASSSAIGFLKQYHEYLTTGEVKDSTSPIIAKYEAGEIPATPALKEIQYAVMSHIIEADKQKMEAGPSASGGGGQKGTRKPWKTTIYNAEGVVQTRVNAKGEEEDLIQGFDLSQRASEWGDRRLFEGTHGWYAIVEHTIIPNIFSRIERGDAMARILRKPKGPTVQQKGKSTKTLGFGVKAKQTRVTFSGS
jgi:hypothetical protein